MSNTYTKKVKGVSFSAKTGDKKILFIKVRPFIDFLEKHNWEEDVIIRVKYPDGGHNHGKYDNLNDAMYALWCFVEDYPFSSTSENSSFYKKYIKPVHDSWKQIYTHI